MSAILKDAPRKLPRLTPMRNADLAEVLSIEDAVYSHPWTRGNFADSLRAGYQCWTWRDGGELLGYFVLLVAAGEGHLLNLESSDLLESLTLLYGGDNISDVAVFGGGLHIKVDDADRAITWIRSKLDAAGIAVSVLEPITPSMEDVFVSLIEQEEKAAA